MMITGIGIDIEEVRRFQKRPYSKNRSFYKKIFTPREIAYCLKSASPAASFAARFAAKEAAIKASGGMVKNLNEVEIQMKGSLPVLAYKKIKTFMSLSHTKSHAAAIVIFTQ